MPVKDRAWFEQQLEHARQEKDRLRAEWNAYHGIEQMCQQAITDLLSTSSEQSAWVSSDGSWTIEPK